MKSGQQIENRLIGPGSNNYGADDNKVSTMSMLKQIRESLGFTLRDVEAKTGISNAYLSQLENGKINNPSHEKMMLLYDLYDISVANTAKYTELDFFISTMGADEIKELTQYAKYILFKRKQHEDTIR